MSRFYRDAEIARMARSFQLGLVQAAYRLSGYSQQLSMMTSVQGGTRAQGVDKSVDNAVGKLWH